MKIKTSDLAGKALRYAVALALGATDFRFDTIATYWMVLNGKDIALNNGWAQAFKPDEDWTVGGPLIDRYIEELHREDTGTIWAATATHGENGPNLLIASMRAIVGYQLGDEVDVPDQLVLKPCRSPYCECQINQCTHPGFYDARSEPL